MKVLFLISSTGKGHARCAEAVGSALGRCSGALQVDYVDLYSVIDPRVGAAVKDGYLRMTTQQPALYQRLYGLDESLFRQLAGEVPADGEIAGFLTAQQRRWFPELAGRRWFASRYPNLDTALINTFVTGVRESRRAPPNRLLLKGLTQLMYRILANRLRDAVQARRPDVLVATHMYPGSLVSRAIKSGVLKQPLIGVVTDFGVHGVWSRLAMRHYCVAHESTARMLVERGVPRKRIHVTGIPLMPAFEHPPARAEARRRLDLDDRPTVLVTGGEYAIGVVEAVQRIVRESSGTIRVLVTAQAGTQGHDRLQSMAAGDPDRLRLHAWTEEMAVLMRAADLVVGKPGGLTVSESLACGRPFIATRSLGGQEAYNVGFLEQHGLGRGIAPVELAPYLRHLLARPPELAAWQERVWLAGSRRGAPLAAELIERCARRSALRQAAG